MWEKIEETMTREEIRKAQRAIEKWRKCHSDIDSLKKAYWESIPEQVRASMAFEGEDVDIKMLEEYLKSLKEKKSRAGTSSDGQRAGDNH